MPHLEAILATRRPRAQDEEPIWVAHVAAVEGETVGATQYETDRARFLGRGRGIRNAGSIEDGRPLSNTAGSVLDPIASLRRRVRLPAGATARVHFATLAADSREKALELADKYREPAAFERTANVAWTQAQVQLRHLGITADEAHLFQRVATRILYSDPSLRAPAHVLLRNRKGASALWPHGISGDLPIVLLRIDDPDDQDIVRQLLRAHEYWRMKGLAVDLVIVNEQASSYGQDLRQALEALVRSRRQAEALDETSQAGGIFLLRRDLISAEDHDLLRSAARVVLLSRHGTLSEQIVRLLRGGPPPSRPGRSVRARPPADISPPHLELEFFNGLGGFGDDGREYVTILGERAVDPGALDQRDRQSLLRFLRVRIRLGLDLGGQQPAEPVDALVQRPRQRPSGRGDPRPRRGDRRDLGADGPSRARRVALRGAARPGVQPIRAREPRHPARPDAVRAARGPGQDLVSRRREPFPRAPGPLGHCVRRMGARRPARRLGSLHHHAAGRGDRGALRA